METSPIFKEGGGNQFFMYTWFSFLAQRNEKMHFFSNSAGCLYLIFDINQNSMVFFMQYV